MYVVIHPAVPDVLLYLLLWSLCCLLLSCISVTSQERYHSRSMLHSLPADSTFPAQLGL